MTLADTPYLGQMSPHIVESPIYSRQCIIGPPRAGKTTLALRIGAALSREHRHTDELINRMPWSEQSEEVACWLDMPGPWIIEGVSLARALRKWLESHPEGKPCELVTILRSPKIATDKFQNAMGKGIFTVWDGIKDQIESRGVRIVELA